MPHLHIPGRGVEEIPQSKDENCANFIKMSSESPQCTNENCDVWFDDGVAGQSIPANP
jgi:hypothetical protein